jgi:hypothetical protein
MRHSLGAALALGLGLSGGGAPGQTVPAPLQTTQPRQVSLFLRDVAAGAVLPGTSFETVELIPQGEGAEVTGRLVLSSRSGVPTGLVELHPGRYVLNAARVVPGRAPIRVAIPVEIPPGSGSHDLDLAIATRLRLEVLLHAGRRLGAAAADRTLPQHGRLSGRVTTRIHPIVNGSIDPNVDYGGQEGGTVMLPPGDYFVRVGLLPVFGRERLITVPPGPMTAVEVDLAAGEVRLDLRDPQGGLIDPYRFEVFDGAEVLPIFGGMGSPASDPAPLYLPAGTWRIEAVAVRGDRRPAVGWITVAPGHGHTVPLTPGLTTGEPGTAAARSLQHCRDVDPVNGCMVEVVTPADVARHLGLTGAAARAQTDPGFAGSWQQGGRILSLVQDGRRVWGDVHEGDRIGRLWGHVGPDGLTLWGVTDATSGERGAMELRLSPDGQRMQGAWHLTRSRQGGAIAARRLSGGLPARLWTTGTEEELNAFLRTNPWSHADGFDFPAFMAPVLAPLLAPDPLPSPVQSAATNSPGTPAPRARGPFMRGGGPAVRDGTGGDPALADLPPPAALAPIHATPSSAAPPGSAGALAQDAGVLGAGLWRVIAPNDALYHDEAGALDFFLRSMAAMCLREPTLVFDDGSIEHWTVQHPGAPLTLRSTEVCRRTAPGAPHALCISGNAVPDADNFEEWRSYIRIDTGLYRASRMTRDGNLLRPLYYWACLRDDDRGYHGAAALEAVTGGAQVLAPVRARQAQGLAAFDPDRPMPPLTVPDARPAPPVTSDAAMAAAGWPGAGLWHVAAPGADLAAGTPEFRHVCLNAPTLLMPDYRILSYEADRPQPGDWRSIHAATCAPAADGGAILCAGSGQVPSDGPQGQHDLRLVFRHDGPGRLIAERHRRDGVALTAQVYTACLRDDGLGLTIDTGPGPGRRLRNAAAGGGGYLGPPLDLDTVRVPVATSVPVQTAVMAFDPALVGLWFAIPDGRSPGDLPADAIAATCRERPGRLHPDGLFMVFGPGQDGPVPESHLRCDADLGCDFFRGAPSEGRPVDGHARLRRLSGDALEACLGAVCLTLGRCADPAWTEHERASGLAARWQDAVARRD